MSMTLEMIREDSLKRSIMNAYVIRASNKVFRDRPFKGYGMFHNSKILDINPKPGEYIHESYKLNFMSIMTNHSSKSTEGYEPVHITEQEMPEYMSKFAKPVFYEGIVQSATSKHDALLKYHEVHYPEMPYYDFLIMVVNLVRSGDDVSEIVFGLSLLGFDMQDLYFLCVRLPEVMSSTYYVSYEKIPYRTEFEVQETPTISVLGDVKINTRA